MLSVIQRVRSACVEVEGEVIGRIDAGLLALVCAQPGDTEQTAERFLNKLLKLRVFTDAEGKMNRSIQDIDGNGRAGGLLLISQFTLAADTRSGTRPGFSGAAHPDMARPWFETLVERARLAHPVVQTGRFAADMQVHLINDGPVTIPLNL